MTLKSLEKIIKYRSTYTGTKETDFLYKKYFINNIKNFSKNDLSLLISIFDCYSDNEIYLILCDKLKPKKKFIELFNKIKKFS